MPAAEVSSHHLDAFALHRHGEAEAVGGGLSRHRDNLPRCEGHAPLSARLPAGASQRPDSRVGSGARALSDLCGSMENA
jgi:hypothetical protein